MAKTSQDAPVKPLTSTKKMSGKVVVALFIVALLAGVGVGYGAASLVTATGGSAESQTEVEKTAGVFDKKTFPDSAEGLLKKGGIEGEGKFHLERPGGLSQNVYLTSSTVDLEQYIGKKVKVWGQTFKAEKAGWLMDVGYVEVK
ncbi:hypothetical protein A3G67_01900 [Candidatus Roizmanbacteria bacterium RIFCSPLOWO2_12_FULL_40_12]|uniref:Uncharacterized protein n=1 Tax=Candidatus Roizmanbacteria bacterium RIFCSPLOWO2_01_FULL_40_42 TaxID=1802066 RepID=A0A1F7J3K0_9BACT|nr:MAG: hypothetical protein A2779_01020 [Candidatus Roizmanbacteria bacterium RIFCSPHIGHO2_01_FULL_40_98]OGK28948.1 MAG: hypothetical protein A3C31_01660 [Candidatus Roizmanbacteria bacterium RIFCSPHIGHO2_02_FULL_40_53]OGK29586.1 MAG: hypothetical protein A2W49_03880 [Candidatus Roizmanbacteria bacterium RIFCSPHIGHO2_12_41_18]OGK36709.1 MAG: hypothetical protein A3E69_03860 [Candidatus Roizmanbacteria bacterium RIFCSPHIGHO2_12_FULL_40_130]OGK50177.1 MAG: hypothetical protein A3B50_00115 [Candi